MILIPLSPLVSILCTHLLRKLTRHSPSGKVSTFGGALEHASDDILNSCINNEQYEYKIADDLKMIICRYFHVQYPIKYKSLLLVPNGKKQDTRSKAYRIMEFWKKHMISDEYSLARKMVCACVFSCVYI